MEAAAAQTNAESWAVPPILQTSVFLSGDGCHYIYPQETVERLELLFVQHGHLQSGGRPFSGLLIGIRSNLVLMIAAYHKSQSLSISLPARHDWEDRGISHPDSPFLGGRWHSVFYPVLLVSGQESQPADQLQHEMRLLSPASPTMAYVYSRPFFMFLALN